MEYVPSFSSLVHLARKNTHTFWLVCIHHEFVSDAFSLGHLMGIEALKVITILIWASLDLWLGKIIMLLYITIVHDCSFLGNSGKANFGIFIRNNNVRWIVGASNSIGVAENLET